MTKIALFGKYGTLLRNLSTEGLQNLGHEIFFQAPMFDESQAVREVSGVVLCGTLRGPLGEAARYYLSIGRTVVMVDAPHLRATEPKQWRITPPDHSHLPFAGEKPPRDRLEALNLKLEQTKPTKNGYVVLAGQRDGDAAHRMNRKEILDWAKRATEKIRSLCDNPIRWRPHPMDVWRFDEADSYSDPKRETLSECLEGAAFLVTYNSTSGLEALMAGIPVIAEGQAHYSELSGSFRDFKNLRPPKEEELKDLLARVAYTQWSEEEIRSGYPFQEFFPGSNEILLPRTSPFQPEEPKPEEPKPEEPKEEPAEASPPFKPPQLETKPPAAQQEAEQTTEPSEKSETSGDSPEPEPEQEAKAEAEPNKVRPKGKPRGTRSRGSRKRNA